MDDSVQIRCTRCKSTFRDRARRLQPGYSRQCPNCEVIIFFEESSADKNVQTALLEARRLRRVLRESRRRQAGGQEGTDVYQDVVRRGLYQRYVPRMLRSALAVRC
jgi:DNA-directed RNA polymerase subunit RPC12/RpoP